jgi:hypothetical protein
MSNDVKLDTIINLIKKLENRMSALQEEIDGVTGTLNKVFTEVTSVNDALKATIADLEAQIADGQTADLTALKEVAGRLDALNPDIVA